MKGIENSVPAKFLSFHSSLACWYVKSYSHISINCFFPTRSILFVKELSLNNTSIYQSDKSSLTLQPFPINLGFVSILIEIQIDIKSRILKKGKSKI